MKLTGKQHQEFSQALRSAFSLERLKRFLLYSLDKNLEDISLGGDLQEIVFDLINLAESEGWIDLLLARAREANPGNPDLFKFAQQFGLATQTPAGPELERLVTQAGFNNVAAWRERLGELETRVCRVEIPLSNGQAERGTGFLVGKDLLLTNYHVLQSVIERSELQTKGEPWAEPQQVSFRFDYKASGDGKTVSAGVVYHLAADWLVDSSPMSVIDYQPEPKNGAPALDELDYALVRLADEPGLSAVGSHPSQPPVQRGWITLPDEPYDFTLATPILILQHPRGAPLKLALDSVRGLNANQTRLTYRTNTERGSSGSPCFSSNWTLIALHHAGDPDYSFGHTAEYNEGIPIWAVRNLLRQRGVDGLLETFVK